MKKFKSLALVLVSLISLASCSSSNNEKKISLTYVNWAEGIAMTHLAKAIFEEHEKPSILFSKSGDICINLAIAR